MAEDVSQIIANIRSQVPNIRAVQAKSQQKLSTEFANLISNDEDRQTLAGIVNIANAVVEGRGHVGTVRDLSDADVYRLCQYAMHGYRAAVLAAMEEVAKAEELKKAAIAQATLSPNLGTLTGATGNL